MTPAALTTVRLPPATAETYLGALQALLAVARPSALFVDRRGVSEWLSFLGRARPRAGSPSVEVHLPSGLPSRRSLLRLMVHQRVAREFLEAHRVPARKAASGYHLALASARLPAVGATQAQRMGREQKGARYLLTHDAVVASTGLLVRVVAQVSLPRSGRLVLERGASAEVQEPLALALTAGTAGAAPAVEALEALAGLEVHEVTYAVLGPFVCSCLPSPAEPPTTVSLFRRALEMLPGSGREGAGLLSLVLERAGDTVPSDRCTDPLGALPRLPPASCRAWRHCFRERRVVCTPGLETPLRELCPGLLVRSR